MGKISFKNSNNPTITMSAVINFPEGFDESKTYPAIVVSHPGGGVKEQTAGTYAAKLAKFGFVTIAYDASYQGESGGEPRQLENPHIRTEDVSAVIDYLTTLAYVDNDRIGAMGICAGAGYTANAASQDRRIKAIGTVSAVNIGSMFRNGWENTDKSIALYRGWLQCPHRGREGRLCHDAFGSGERSGRAERRASSGMGILPHRPRAVPNLTWRRNLAQLEPDHHLRRLSHGRRLSDPADPDRRGQRGRQQVDERRPL
ncbi:Dienelactone hydrolase family protein [Agrobacterium fabrum]|uniref:Dienelactone hydrolase family protein n=1 Tax=Agrobacterium fabrum TaxID=1176649 RepID=A0A7Z7BS78_9HYPH|nr:alpha/beta hydrolase [Agrobacterium fabrum]SDK40089.1 Dienelactone hydrolase family protein [Agrobacterium fabrum]